MRALAGAPARMASVRHNWNQQNLSQTEPFKNLQSGRTARWAGAKQEKTKINSMSFSYTSVLVVLIANLKTSDIENGKNIPSQ